jgi:hypothetical protein
VQYNDESTEKEEDVRVQDKEEDDESIGEDEYYSTLQRLPPPF